MGKKRSKHYNAVLKYIKEKKIALQRETELIMNGSIKTAVDQLENEGKIKRKKVGVRQINGNLNYSWLLYLSGTDHNDILDFEKELINRPYESPLKEHHCYKMTVAEAEEFTVTEVDNGNVIDMQEYIKINDYDLMIKEYRGQRVVTTKDIAKAHNKTIKGVNQQLERNKTNLIENEDYFIVTRDKFKVTGCDLEKYFTSNSQKNIYLITESGYMMLVKSFVDKLSWTIQRDMQLSG